MKHEVELKLQAWVDGQSLRTYRHTPNTGSRKSWAAGDATARAVRLALISKTGEMGYPSVLTAKNWGFYDVLFKGKEFKFQRKFGSYVMEQVLFKISFPAEFHAQTAVECAMSIFQQMKSAGKTSDGIKKIRIRTHEAAIRIIDKKGPLANPADRDHCIQYMVAVPLIFGRLTAADYEDDVAKDKRIDSLRSKIQCVEDKRFTRDYHAPDKRSIANALTVELKDGTKLEEVVCEYPIGHKRRRKEGMPVLVEKFKTNLARRFPEKQRKAILDLCLDAARLEKTPVREFVDLGRILEEQDRKTGEFQALKKGLGYCWSVAVAALPEEGKPRMENWLSSPDPDVAWIMSENLKKKRLEKMDPAWVVAQRYRLT